MRLPQVSEVRLLQVSEVRLPQVFEVRLLQVSEVRLQQVSELSLLQVFEVRLPQVSVLQVWELQVWVPDSEDFYFRGYYFPYIINQPFVEMISFLINGS